MVHNNIQRDNSNEAMDYVYKMSYIIRSQLPVLVDLGLVGGDK